VEVARAREVKIVIDGPTDFEDERQQRLRELEAWMREHPEAS
jgi:hypothetical protein